MDAENQLIESLAEDRDALEKQVEDMEGEIERLKWERAILIDGLNAVRWRIDLTFERLKSRP